ncbi:MAG: divalent metal cation transporter, partial [Acidimicrobiia bacterium]|nr:divalent metal cation transporter [Acidimicrobiia bacterium]
GDAVGGSFVATAAMWFILVATGATLGVHHHSVDTAEQAAEALRPLAGSAATVLFAVGLLISAVLALPVLMITTGRVVGSEFNWRERVLGSLPNAPRFYAAVGVATALGAAIALGGVPPIRILFIASIVGGLATPVSLAFLVLVGSDRRAMGGRPVSRPLAIAGWTVTGVVSLAGLAFLAQQAGAL